MKTKGQEIINLILEFLEVKAPTFATNIDVAYQRIYDIQRGKTNRISPELGDKIVKKYPQFNLSWLLSGEGEMLNTGDATIKGNNNITNTGLIGGNASINSDARIQQLEKEVELQKQLLEEKERMIQVLLNQNKK